MVIYVSFACVCIDDIILLNYIDLSALYKIFQEFEKYQSLKSQLYQKTNFQFQAYKELRQLQIQKKCCKKED